MKDKAVPPPILALVLVTAMSPLALNIFLPSMPSMARDFGVETSAIQPAISLYFLGIALGQLIYGPISDRFGRRPVLIVGATVYALTNFHLIFTDTVSGLILGRMIQAFGGCAGIVLTRAIVRDVYATEQSASAMGYITTSMIVVPALAPALGAYLDMTLGWRSGFVALTGFSVLASIGIVFFIGETNRHFTTSISVTNIIRNYASLLRNQLFILYFLTITFSSASFFAFVAGAPHAVMDVMGYSPQYYAHAYIGMAFAYMAGSFMAGRFSVRMGLHPMLAVGMGLTALGGFGVLGQLISGPSLAGLFIPVAIGAVGGGLGNPAILAGALAVRPQIAGAASGLLGFGPLLLGAVLSEVIGHSYAYGIVPFLFIYATTCLAAAFFSLYAIRCERQLRQDQSSI